MIAFDDMNSIRFLFIPIVARIDTVADTEVDAAAAAGK